MKRLGVVLLAVLSLACAELNPQSGAAVSDSAGIRIVTNTAAQFEEAPHWGLVLDLELVSTEEDEVTLYRVGAVTPLGGDRIAVLNGGLAEVLVFDREGKLLTCFGGAGDGPGEFRAMASLVQVGPDSIGVYDSRRKRLSVFTAEGKLAREITLDPVPAGSSYEFLLPLASGDFVVFTQGGLNSERQGVFRAMSESVVIRPDGSVRSSLGQFPGTENFVGRFAGPVLFGAGTYAATVGNDVIVGTSEEPEIRRYAANGSLKEIIRWPDHDRTVGDARFESYAQAALATVPEAGRSQARQLLEELPRSPREPAYGSLVSSGSGMMWIGAYPGPEVLLPDTRPPASSAVLVDQNGGVVAVVDTPVGFRAEFLGESEVGGVYRDELGVESVRVYRFASAPGGQ